MSTADLSPEVKAALDAHAGVQAAVAVVFDCAAIGGAKDDERPDCIE